MKALAITTMLVLSAAFFGGCAKRVVFTTQSSIGLDISGTTQYPNKVSLSYNRYEGAIVPKKETSDSSQNESHSIFGGLDADLQFGFPPKYMIQQTFATGRAAQIATHSTPPTLDANDDDGAASDSPKKSRYPLVFFTGTTFGLHLTTGEGQQQISPNALLGYRRSETAVIPVPDSTREVRSVYADISIRNADDPAAVAATTANTPPPSRLGGVRMTQSFATGQAAENLVTTDRQAKEKLRQAAKLSPVDFNLNLKTQIKEVKDIEQVYLQADADTQGKIRTVAQAIQLVEDPQEQDWTERLRAAVKGESRERTEQIQQLRDLINNLQKSD